MISINDINQSTIGEYNMYVTNSSLVCALTAAGVDQVRGSDRGLRAAAGGDSADPHV